MIIFLAAVRKNRTPRLQVPNNNTRLILEERLQYDYNLYTFIKQLFYKQVKWVKKENIIKEIMATKLLYKMARG